MVSCKICDSLSEFVFGKKILQKYNASFFKCTNCGFLQTESPYWLEESYRLPFTPLDVWLVARPLNISQVTENLILNYFDPTKRFLDYGGGIGVFTRMMRDRGFQFYRQDKYAQNLFTQFFDVSDLPQDHRDFELITCFEVLEHLENPLDELNKMFSLGSNVFCSTTLQPEVSIEQLQSWIYIAELHGQHISFYTRKSMEIIADKFGCYYYSDHPEFHLFTSKKIKNFTFSREYLPYRVKQKLIHSIDNLYTRLFSSRKPLPSLTNTDFDWVKEQLNQQEQSVELVGHKEIP